MPAVSHSENWDSGVTPPALPSTWTSSGMSGVGTATTGATPISSPNMVFVQSHSSVYQTATYQSQDGNSGNVIVTGTGQFVNPASGIAFSVFARGSANPIAYTSSTFYELQLSMTAFNVNAVVAGVSTNVFTVATSAVAANVWYQISGSFSGSTIDFSVQRLSDGFWLDMTSGTFGVGTTFATGSDSSISGQGYLGWGAVSTTHPSAVVFGDDWSMVPAGNALSATESHDAFAATGGFSDLGSISVTAGSDTASFTGHFKANATLAITAASDTFAGSAKFQALASMAKTESHDAFAASGSFATSASIAATEAHDAFAGSGIGPTASIAATEHGDVFSGTALVAGNATMAATERHDAMSCFAQVSPFLRAREGGDVFAGSGSSTTSTSSMAVTTGSDTFSATGGFSFDTVATMHKTEAGDVAAFVGTESSSATMAAHEHGDSFVGTSAVHVTATMGATESGDVFRGGFETILYSIYANTGHGDPINFSSPIDVTAGLTFTTSPLSFPGTWSFDVRAKWAISGLEEANVDARVDIVLDSLGRDITNTPPAPLGLRAFATASSSIRAEWTSPPTTPAKTPTSFNVYSGITTPSYSSPIAVIQYSSGLAGSFVANLTTGFTDGVTYAIAVRAVNATGIDQNNSFVLVTADGTGPSPVVSLTARATI